MNKQQDKHLAGRLFPVAPRWVSEVVCAFACIGATIILRLLINLVAPGVAPFALIYPAALAATLVAGWRSGALCFAVSMGLAWLAVFRAGNDGRVTPVEFLNIVLYGAGVVMVILVAEGFRRAHERTRAERMARVAEHELLLRELNHRVKNNFQMVSSLLDMQRRRAADEATSAALEDTLRRVQSMAQAHVALYHDPTHVSAVDAKAYLGDLCASLADSLLLSGDVRLEFEGESAMLTRDRAVALGMVLNELVTNAAKYAFPGGRSGVVRVAFARNHDGYRLTVSDDGVGAKAGTKPGLGKRIVEAFARQAGGSLRTEPGPGVTVVLDLPA